MRKKIYFLVLYAFSLIGAAQAIKIGDWNIHANYSNVNVMTAANNKAYIGTSAGLFVYNNDDNSLATFSELDGLSSSNVNALAYDVNTSSLFVGYLNGKMDIIYNDQVFSVFDIYLSNVVGSKKINNIYLDEKFAYLSCDFGLVVYSVEKREIKETYYFYENNVIAEVYQSHLFDDDMNGGPLDTFLANKIFVATDLGLFYANKHDNLLDQGVWKNNAKYLSPKLGEQNIKGQSVKNIVGLDLKENGGKKLMIGVDVAAQQNEHNLFEIAANTTLENLLFNHLDFGASVLGVQYNPFAKKTSIITSDERLILLDSFFNVLEATGPVGLNNLYSSPAIINSLVLDDYNISGKIILNDTHAGLVLVQNNNGLKFIDFVCPNGPFSANIGSISNFGSNLIVTHGGRTTSWNNANNLEEVSFFNNQLWSHSDTLITIGTYDVVTSCAVSNNNFFLGTWNSGLLEFKNYNLINRYSAENTEALEPISGLNWNRIGGIDVDQDNTLWITNSETNRPLVKFSPSQNSWNSFVVPDLGASKMSGKILCAKNDYKWIQFRNPGGYIGLMALKEVDNQIESQEVKINESPQVNCFDEDENGMIWIGTSIGLSVIYNPEEVFNNPSYSAEHVLVEAEDGNVERLFDNMEILDIQVDEGNRKWVATKTSGVFLVSEDGSKQIHNFTKENSPLIDNTVYKISIMDSSGEIFFATTKGLCSYRSNATESQLDFENVLVFPNPVKKNYSGTIAISGLSHNTSVKITDVSGNLVFETFSFGGTATWDGRRFNGERVKTGVYLFLCTSENFEKSVVKKILIY